VVTSSEHEAATGGGNKLLYRESEYDKIREWQFIDFAGTTPLGTFQAHKDLFGDGSVSLIDVTGATAGGVTLLVRLPTMPVVLCGNLAWTQEQYFRVRQPGLLFDRSAWWETAWRLKKFKELVPELVVLPDHDWKAVEAVKSKDIVIHAFKKKEEEKGEGGKGEKGKK
jgi:glyoxylase-like metal-dependent hydrolase (beta-lactamase superfamily II)